jgi:hypothetical protein
MSLSVQYETRTSFIFSDFYSKGDEDGCQHLPTGWGRGCTWQVKEWGWWGLLTPLLHLPHSGHSGTHSPSPLCQERRQLSYILTETVPSGSVTQRTAA